MSGSVSRAGQFPRHERAAEAGPSREAEFAGRQAGADSRGRPLLPPRRLPPVLPPRGDAAKPLPGLPPRAESPVSDYSVSLRSSRSPSPVPVPVRPSRPSRPARPASTHEAGAAHAAAAQAEEKPGLFSRIKEALSGEDSMLSTKSGVTALLIGVPSAIAAASAIGALAKQTGDAAVRRDNFKAQSVVPVVTIRKDPDIVTSIPLVGVTTITGFATTYTTAELQQGGTAVNAIMKRSAVNEPGPTPAPRMHDVD